MGDQIHTPFANTPPPVERHLRSEYWVRVKTRIQKNGLKR